MKVPGRTVSVWPGTGRSRDEAWAPAVVRTKGWTVAVFAVTAIFNDENLTVIGHPAECCLAWADTLLAADRFRAARGARVGWASGWARGL